jgi:formate dehydrogenase maturation protein FdhE
MVVLWRSQADEIEALRAEVRNLRGEMAAQRVELEEMDTLVERMVLCNNMAQMQFVLQRATTIAGRRQKERQEQLVPVCRSPPKAPH